MFLKWSVRRRARAIVFVLVFIKYLRFKEHFYSSKSRECWKAARLLIIYTYRKRTFSKRTNPYYLTWLVFFSTSRFIFLVYTLLCCHLWRNKYFPFKDFEFFFIKHAANRVSACVSLPAKWKFEQLFTACLPRYYQLVLSYFTFSSYFALINVDFYFLI